MAFRRAITAVAWVGLGAGLSATEPAQPKVAPPPVPESRVSPVLLPTPVRALPVGRGLDLPDIDTRPLGLNPATAPPVLASGPEKLQEATRGENWLLDSLAALRSEDLERNRSSRDKPREASRLGGIKGRELSPDNLWPSNQDANSGGLTPRADLMGLGARQAKDAPPTWVHPTPVPNPYLSPSPGVPAIRSVPPSGYPTPTPPLPLPTPSPMPPVYEREKDPAYRSLPRF